MGKGVIAYLVANYLDPSSVSRIHVGVKVKESRLGCVTKFCVTKRRNG